MIYALDFSGMNPVGRLLRGGRERAAGGRGRCGAAAADASSITASPFEVLFTPLCISCRRGQGEKQGRDEGAGCNQGVGGAGVRGAGVRGAVVEPVFLFSWRDDANGGASPNLEAHRLAVWCLA